MRLVSVMYGNSHTWLDSMEAVFPLVKKYGGLVVALTLDESGIPETANGRVRIAEKILEDINSPSEYPMYLYK